MNDSTQNTTHPIGRHGISSSFLLVMRSCVCVGVPWWNSFHSRILPTASIDNQQFDIVSTTYYVRVPHITTIHQYRYNKAPNSSFWWQVRQTRYRYRYRLSFVVRLLDWGGTIGSVLSSPRYSEYCKEQTRTSHALFFCTPESAGCARSDLRIQLLTSTWTNVWNPQIRSFRHICAETPNNSREYWW